MPGRGRRLCAISVDLDETPNYYSIHGLAEPGASAPGRHAVYDVALARLEAFASAHRLPLTFFAIGRDLERAESARTLRRLCDKGHAVENHSFDHRYDLTRLDSEGIAREIERGSRAIETAVGRRPQGFRAPGYTVNDTLFDALEAASVVFDSSVFPCPGYYSAKALIMGVMRLRGRPSGSIVGSPRVLLAPTKPYRPGRPWNERGSRSFMELPIQVTPGLRLPVIGTLIGLVGVRGARVLGRMCAGETLINIELHGMDALDIADGIEELAPYQPELRTPLSSRLDAIAALVDVLAAEGYSFVRLDEVADELQRTQ